jgi:predicted NBD/HSP70 family sugar kinase
MPRSIGVIVADRMIAAVVEGSRIEGGLRYLIPDRSSGEGLSNLPAEALCDAICAQVAALAGLESVHSVGVALPGMIRGGIVEESANLQQIKGLNMRQRIAAGLREAGIDVAVSLSNDADALAAGIAATRGHLDRLIRVWTLGNGVGFGRYPVTDGIWEGGHMVVTLDPKERFCGCGGSGHLEGIMGHRAMRLRFMDMEPDEVFAHAKSGDDRCAEFVQFWHRALAAATASNIHMDGAGKFFLTGSNTKYLDLKLLNRYVSEMVKLSALQGYVFEVVPKSDEIAVIGAAVNARQQRS